MTNDIKTIADGLSELLPCPFCQRAADIEIDRDDFDIARAFCTQCGACGPFINLGKDVKADVAEVSRRWNTRSITTLEAENASLREALATIAARNFNCSVHQHGMAAAGLAERTLLALSTQGTTDKDSPDGDA